MDQRRDEQYIQEPEGARRPFASTDEEKQQVMDNITGKRPERRVLLTEEDVANARASAEEAIKDAVKYELVKDDFKDIGGQRVYRIRALKDFMYDPNDPGHYYPGVRKGMLGGYVQSESNLSHEGDCWIGTPGAAGDTIVYGGSKVEGSGMVRGNIVVWNSHITGFVSGDNSLIRNSQVFHNGYVHNFNNGKIDGCHITDNAEVRYGGNLFYTTVSGEARVEGSPGTEINSSRISGSAMVKSDGSEGPKLDNVFLEEDALIRNNAKVFNTTICGSSFAAGDCDIRDSFISGRAGIGGDAVLEHAVVTEEALVYGDARVSHSKVQDTAQVGGHAVVEDSIVAGKAKVQGDAVVRNFKLEEIVFRDDVSTGIHDAEQISLSMEPVKEKERAAGETCYISLSMKHRRETEYLEHVPLFYVYTKEKDDSLTGFKENVLAFFDTLEEAKQGAKENGFKNVVLENVKYELARDEASTTVFGKKHYRVRALQDIPEQGIPAGRLGGFVESENNLSQEGSCWIAHDALVTGNARVRDDAVVSGRATVMDNAAVQDKAMVSGFAVVAGNAVVQGRGSHVAGDALVMDKASVSSYGFVSGQALVCGNSIIVNAMVRDSAVVRDSRVWGGAEVGGNAVVTDQADLKNGIKLSGYDYAEGNKPVREQERDVRKRFYADREEKKKKRFVKRADAKSQITGVNSRK